MRRVLFLLAVCFGIASVNAAPQYELAINGGRVIDPETGLDAVRSVGISGGSIVAISEQALKAAKVIDAKNLVVAPGFINVHTHTPTPLGQHYEALDGVTTALDLEAGSYPVASYGELIADKALINFGTSVGHVAIRLVVVDGVDVGTMITKKGISMSGRAVVDKIDAEQRAQMRELFVKGLQKGGLGIGLALDYVSVAVDDAELDLIFEVAGEYQVPIFVHVRRGVAGDPAGLIEVLEAAERHSAPLQVVHINASAMGGVGEWLRLIDAARDRGVDVSSEMFPWTAGSASISAAVFGRNWREVFAIDYEDVQWSATGEWMTPELFDHYRKNEPRGLTIHHYIKEEWNREAIKSPYVMVASDAMPLFSVERKVVPNGIGTSAKVLGRYVREQGLLDMQTAIAKLSLLPSQRLESFAPAFKRKGRIQEGADADITIFDPATVRDRASYMEPFVPSTGITHVLVNGAEIVAGGELVEGVYPGRRLLSTENIE